MRIQLEVGRDGMLVVDSDYHPGLVAALKGRLPAWGRYWDGSVWLVAPMLSGALRGLLKDTMDYDPPRMRGESDPKRKTEVLRLEYLGQAKDRGWEVATAYGHDEDDWNLIFPLPTLQSWFGAIDKLRPAAATSHYAALGVPPDAPDKDIKAAYHYLARRWHPDVCDAPDATEQFRAVKEAYDTLKNKRAQYDAARAIAATINSHQTVAVWKPPSRCGLLLAETLPLPQPGRVYVSRLLQWQDIINDAGQRMYSYWPPGADSYKTDWR